MHRAALRATVQALQHQRPLHAWLCQVPTTVGGRGGQAAHYTAQHIRRQPDSGTTRPPASHTGRHTGGATPARAGFTPCVGRSYIFSPACPPEQQRHRPAGMVQPHTVRPDSTADPAATSVGADRRPACNANGADAAAHAAGRHASHGLRRAILAACTAQVSG